MEVQQRVEPAVVEVLRPTIGGLTDEVLEQVIEAVPPFAEWWGGPRDVRDGVELALRGFIELLERDGDERVPGYEVFFDFGRSEQRAGRTPVAVMTAYRVGAQAAWRAMAQTGDAAGVQPQKLYAVADVIFHYIDRVCAATAEGYVYEQSLEAVEHVDARRRLVELAVGPAPVSELDLATLAADAGWRVPARVTVVAFRGERVSRMAARLPADALVARVGGVGWALIGDPDGPGRRAVIRKALYGVRSGVGPVVGCADVPESARLARRALELAVSAERAATVVADERRIDLLLLADRGVAGDLVADVLGPLDGLPATAQDRLLETLGAWLEHQGEVRPAAAQLHVHTQTVRYRVAQLRELLGDRMATAEGRLELELALRARRLLGAAPGPELTAGQPTIERTSRV